VQLQTCANGAFGAAVWSDAGGWPVGIGNGVGGAAVIETYLPLARLAGAGPVRVGVISTDGQVSDALTGGANGQPLVIALNGNGAGDPAAIPMLNPWTLGLLIALLGRALRWGRRWPGAARLLVLVVVVTGAGLAWAAFVRDGQTNDWAGVAPLATQTSTVTGPSKIVALFGKAEAGNLNFRIDAGIVSLNQALPRVQLVAANSLYSDSISLEWLATFDNSTANSQIRYILHASTESGFVPNASTAKIELTNVDHGTFTGLTANTLYYVKVEARDTQGRSSWSNELSAVTATTNPRPSTQPIRVLDATSVPNQTVTAGSISYQLPSGGQLPSVGELLVSDLGNGYLRRVTAVNRNGNQVTVQTEPAAVNDAFDELHFSSEIKLIDLPTAQSARSPAPGANPMAQQSGDSRQITWLESGLTLIQENPTPVRHTLASGGTPTVKTATDAPLEVTRLPTTSNSLLRYNFS
jgi:hypothetical protein